MALFCPLVTARGPRLFKNIFGIFIGYGLRKRKNVFNQKIISWYGTLVDF
jgi:hypothetical protein